MAENEQEGAAAAEAVIATPKGGKLKLAIIVVAALTILGGGAATWFFFFHHPGDEAHAEAPPAKPPTFIEVPEMLVNMVSGPGERVQYLKLKIVLEVKDDKRIEEIKWAMPRVTDLFQTYMRELRPADLNGSAGLFRLKEELTRRVNNAVAPQQVSAVLFKEIIVQ